MMFNVVGCCLLCKRMPGKGKSSNGGINPCYLFTFIEYSRIFKLYYKCRWNLTLFFFLNFLQYLERRECEYDLKSSVNFYKVNYDLNFCAWNRWQCYLFWFGLYHVWLCSSGGRCNKSGHNWSFSVSTLIYLEIPCYQNLVKNIKFYDCFCPSFLLFVSIA